MIPRDLADIVDVHVTIAPPSDPAEESARLLRYFEGEILRIYGPERFDEAMRVFHAASAQYAAERGRQ